MALDESIVEDAALEWFLLRQGFGGQVGELGYAVGRGPLLAPGEQAGGTPTPALSHGERVEDGEVGLVGRLRVAIRRLNPAIPDEASAGASLADRRATIRPYRRVQISTGREMKS